MGNSFSFRKRSSQSRPLCKQRSATFAKLGDIPTCAPRTEDEDPSIKEKARPLEFVTLAYSLSYNAIDQSHPAFKAFEIFINIYPEYRLTWILDALRKTDYKRLEHNEETYVDYMGGALYPESLIKIHTDFLNASVLGNTHSVSNSSKLSLKRANEARAAVLSFFNAPPDYTVIFVPNATGALKLVGESYPFGDCSNFILGTDAHNSVHGIRQFAASKGAKTIYIPSTPVGGMNAAATKTILFQNRPMDEGRRPSLFALTGQSNVTNSKNNLTWIQYAASLGYHTLLDAAALAPTSSFSLSEIGVDAMAVSFYKMVGFPTGVGALVVKKSFLAQLKRPWFAGGTVDIVQVPGTIVTRSDELHEQFEDGTINYLTLPAVTDGLRFLSAYLPFLPLRLSCLLHYLITALAGLRHDITKRPVVDIVSRRPDRRLKSIGDQADTGSTISLVFLDPDGGYLPNSFIEYSASRHRISLRTGCMCNPGGAAAILGLEESMQSLTPGITRKGYENEVGWEIGVVRISLGLASNFEDAWRVLEFASLIGQHETRQRLWKEWMESLASEPK